MRILRPLSSLLIFLIFFLYSKNLYPNEPIDIWKIEKNTTTEVGDSISSINSEGEKTNGIKINSQNENIIVNNKLDSSDIRLVGLYDPAENNLSIDMWSNSDGEEIKKIFNEINKLQLSDISNELLDIALLTNSYNPENISFNEFLDIKFDYLIKKKNFELIKKFLIKNPKIKNKDKLIRFYADHYLTNSQINESCEIFKISNLITDDYLINFKIYCLINENKKEEAQLLFDLKSELGNMDEFFIKKFNILMGYEKKDEMRLDNNILNLHLSHITNEKFIYEPNMDTPKFVWKYLSSSNLLKKANLIDVENIDQIKIIEKATNEGIYDEKELLDIYMRFQFDINQLLNVNEAYKILPDYEGRALLYQRLILTFDSVNKLDLSSKLKKSFDKSNLSNAFDDQLSGILKTIDENDIPSNFTTFYQLNKEPEKIKASKIKFNNKLIHQSKLLNYFLNKTSLPKVEKETNDLLKKIKKNKKYKVSKKDIMMIESLKSDGVQVLKKYDNLYQYRNNIPKDIKSKILNGEKGLVLLKIIEIIGENDIDELDIESIAYVVEIMNELKTIDLRNQILLKVLPLKV